MQLRDQKIGLGSAQWGLDYGVANTLGQASNVEITAILEKARSNGIKTIDTACLYGNSESKLGMQDLKGFQVVSKTPHCTSIAGDRDAYEFLNFAIRESLTKLRIPKLSGYLVHRADDLLGSNGRCIARALNLIKESGLADKVGVSIYRKDQLDHITKFFIPDLIQVPINVFDQRLIKSGTLRKMKDFGVEIHSRSTFLQGVMLMPLSQVPIYFNPVMPLLKQWHQRLKEQEISPIQAAISFVCGVAEVDKVILGVEHAQQLEGIIQFSGNNILFDAKGFDCDDQLFIDPTNWNLE